MLKKNNKILVGCLALLLVMTVGYALFSETITINGTATAKGEFDITATCTPGLSSESGGTISDVVNDYNNFLKVFYNEDADVYNAESITSSSESGYENDTCSVSGNVVTYHVDLKYPGAQRFFTVKLTNTGTIPAVTDLDSFGSMSSSSSSWPGERFTMVAYYQNNKNLYTIENVDLDNEDFKNFPVLNPTESVYAIICVAWNINDSSNNRNGSVNVKEEFKFKQVTVN